MYSLVSLLPTCAINLVGLDTSHAVHPFVQNPMGNLKMFIIPAAILGMVMSGTTMRMTRTMMLEVLRGLHPDGVVKRSERKGSVMQMSETPAHWALPTVLLGPHEPVWLDR